MISQLTKMLIEAKHIDSSFKKRNAILLEKYNSELSQGFELAVFKLSEDVSTISAGNELCKSLMQLTTEYVLWLRWTLLDLPYYAIVFETPLEKFRHHAAAAALVYQSIRILDDALDSHLTYKDLHPTLLGTTSKLLEIDFRGASASLPSNLSILVSMLLSLEGLRLLSSNDKSKNLEDLMEAYRKTIIGAILEYAQHSDKYTHDYYKRLITLKNVNYSRILISQLTNGQPKDEIFLSWIDDLYFLSQQINDLHDLQHDVTHQQPNIIWNVLKEQHLIDRMDIHHDEILDATIINFIDLYYAKAMIELGDKAHSLSGNAKAVAFHKWYDLYQYMQILGIFACLQGKKSTGIRIK